MQIVFLGSGNLATNLSLALKAAGEEIIQIFSRTQENAQALADKLHCASCTSINEIRTDADVYIFSVKDDALPSLIEQLAVLIETHGKALRAHDLAVVRHQLLERHGHPFTALWTLEFHNC